MTVRVYPCHRPGCRQRAVVRFCSRRCVALVRIAAGWKPHASFMRPEIRAKALKRAGEVTGEKRRRARRQRVLTKLGGFLTPQFCGELSPRQVAAVKALLARAYIRGRADGYGSGWDCGRRTGQKGRAA